MRIVIDLQAVQCEGNRFRGIGRYGITFAKALLRAEHDDEIWVAVNGEIPDSVEYVRAELDGCIPQERIVVWRALPDTAQVNPENHWRHQAAVCVREEFLASLRPDLVHVCSLIEGYYDDLVTSVNPDSPFATTVTLFDLIPLIYADAYLADPAVRAWYLGKTEELKRADMLLGISEDACNDARQMLGIPLERLVNVQCAADSMFRQVEIAPERRSALRERFGIRDRFLMYTGGIDYRKNVEGLIQSYAALEPGLRATSQLLIVCAVHPHDLTRLQAFGEEVGLVPDDLVFTGYVSDAELLGLYRSCEALVFPSWHEGFGLPPLEAMACGAAVIGSNTSSVPEVIGRTDALFDPRDLDAITAKMRLVLTDETYREALRAHGPRQARKFSWEKSARRVLAAMHVAHEQWLTKVRGSAAEPPSDGKLLLAYVSPVPPENSGVADLSAELLPALAEHYRIEVVSDQLCMSDPWMLENVVMRSTDWFRQNASAYDRIVYQLGNGGLHAHMLELLENAPGTVLLHEIFLSGITRHLGLTGQRSGYWERSIYESHGYAGLLALQSFADSEVMTQHYPCSMAVIRDADGIVVHSRFNAENADRWYGDGTAAHWDMIPLLREVPPRVDRDAARQRLGINDGEVLVCCFGIVAPFKLNHRVLEGWLASRAARERKSRLAFVGANHDPGYAGRMRELVLESGREADVTLTGFVERQTYLDYAAAADVAVQLRGFSRGEASYSVLDCLAHGIPTVINAHGPMAELPPDAALMIPDDFQTSELTAALDRLADDADLRRALALNAQAHCRDARDPAKIALLYRNAIERHFRYGKRGSLRRLGRRIMATVPPPGPTPADLQRLALGVAANQPRAASTRQMLVDISELVRRDAKSGIQRVVRSVLACLLKEQPAGFRVEPVYAEPGGRYRYARAFTIRFLGLSHEPLPDDLIDTDPGDIFLGLDLVPELPCHVDQLKSMRARGVALHFVLHDLLPLSRPDCFPAGSYEGYGNWLRAVLGIADGVMCVSRSVAEDLYQHADSVQIPRLRPLRIGWFHHGSDISSSVPSSGITAEEESSLSAVQGAPAFLVVGTLEPRKGHAQALAGFELLWAKGNQARLVIVGKSGWLADSTLERLLVHPERGKRLFWFEAASDELLTRLYRGCTALLLPSEGEGFGLPLIEAAHHELPILCRDLNVFREVAGPHATYFSGYDPADLAHAVESWLQTSADGKAPGSGHLPQLDWRQATELLLAGVLRGSQTTEWMPGRRFWLPAYDHRLDTQHCKRVRDWLEPDGDGSPIVRSWPFRLPAGRYGARLHADWVDCHGFAQIRLVNAQDGSIVAQQKTLLPDASLAGKQPGCEFDVSREYRSACLEIQFTPAARWRLRGCGLTALGGDDEAGRERNHAFQPCEPVADTARVAAAGGERQLLVDVSESARRDARGGVQRVVRSVLGALLASPPAGFKVEPIRTEPGEPYRYARNFLARFTGQHCDDLPEPAVVFRPGDVFLGLDLSAHEWTTAPQQFQAMRDQGACVYPVLYDLLPILRSDCFIHAPYELYEGMITAFAKASDGIICISQSVAEDLQRYLDVIQPERDAPLPIGWFHLGADLVASRPSEGIAAEESEALKQLEGQISFLAVGTVEPRKGYTQTLDAFERLWGKGSSNVLVIVGAPGWLNEQLLDRLRTHHERGRRLFWFSHASDELLMRLYDCCTALLAPSEGEGFGLPLIEAARHGLPILCRDIPAFREVAGECAAYFSGHSAAALANAIEDWVALSARSAAPDSRGMSWLSWSQSTRQLLEVALKDKWGAEWTHSRSFWFPVHDRRMTVLGAREKSFAVSNGNSGVLLQTWPIAVPAGEYHLRVSGEWWSETGEASVELLSGRECKSMRVIRFGPGRQYSHGCPLDTSVTISADADVRLRVNVRGGGILAVEGCGLLAQAAENGSELLDQPHMPRLRAGAAR